MFIIEVRDTIEVLNRHKTTDEKEAHRLYAEELRKAREEPWYKTLTVTMFKQIQQAVFEPTPR